MRDWELKPARDLNMPLAQRNRFALRESGLIGTILRTAWWCGVRAWMALGHRLQVHGRRHLPLGSSFLIAANHASHLDALVIGSAIPLPWRDQVFPLAAGDIFFGNSARAAFSATMLNALPVWRKNARLHGLAGLRERLARERCIYVLFPEGKRTRSGRMNRFRAGAGMFVAGTDVPIVPCYLQGTYEALPPGRVVPRPLPISLWFGQPMTFADTANDHAGWNHVARRTELAVRDLPRRARHVTAFSRPGGMSN